MDKNIIDDDTIKENIASYRKQQGLTQKEMARRLNVERTTYRNLEKGKTRILNENLGRIADELNISTTKLVLGYEPDRDGSKGLEDFKAEYDRKYKRMEDYYRERLEALEKELEMSENHCRTLQSQIKDKDQIILMLKKQTGKSS